MTTNNHPAHGPLSLDRLRQISEILSKASAQSDGGNLGYAMADAVKVIDEMLERRKTDATPEFHTEASRFLPECLKAEEISGERRNSRIAELMGWFDRYYSGKANPKWFKPHAAELCYYILTAPPAPVVPNEKPMPEASKMHAIDAVAAIAEVRGWNACRAAMLQAEPVTYPYKFPPNSFTDEDLKMMAHGNNPQSNAYRELLAFRRNSPVTPDGWIPVSERMPERDIDVQVYCADKKEQMVGYLERNEAEGWFRFASLPNGGGVYCKPTHWMPLPAAPKQED